MKRLGLVTGFLLTCLMIVTLAMACDSNKRADAAIKEADEIIEQYETRGATSTETQDFSEISGETESDENIITEEETTAYFEVETFTAPDSAWIFIHEPKQFNSTYEGVHCITDETSAQWEWLQSHDWGYFDNGVCRFGGRMLVALTPAFGKVGDYVDLLLSNGQILYCIMIDEKADCDTYGHWDGDRLNIIELVVSPDWYETEHDNIWYPDVMAFRSYNNESGKYE